MMDGKCIIGSPKTRMERALGRTGLIRILHEGGFPSPSAVPPARNNDWQLSAKATPAHPKNTSPVAADVKDGDHDAEDNELKEYDVADDKVEVLIIFL
ncbi:hypothetical protein CQW23_24249 [Capsicum baccatum]|uniref:Uncharacterized protein n=1 Tax=Capsicum baccatum TaxID=33114 RepID=A0A2G2VU80_CAPBA|nr:hypothetical protein CQW23_24249 [Capsicum baccatum]